MSNSNYVRNEPAEWAELLSNAQRAIPSRRRRRYWRAYRLVKQAEDLSGLALERNFHHGLGKIMYKMAERLRKPAERQKLIGAAALSMVSAALEWRVTTVPMDEPFVPVVGDLRALVVRKKPAAALARNSWADLPPAEQMLTNALATATALRRAALERERSPLGRVVARATNSVLLREDANVVTAIAQNTFAGANAVLGMLLRKLPPQQELTEEQLHIPIDLKKAAAFRLPTYFAPSARLRLDEFESGHGWEGEGSSLRFDPSVLNRPPSKPEGFQVLRTERLGCPALFADGLAMDIAINILPQTIELARSIVPNDYFRILHT